MLRIDQNRAGDLLRLFRELAVRISPLAELTVSGQDTDPRTGRFRSAFQRSQRLERIVKQGGVFRGNGRARGIVAGIFLREDAVGSGTDLRREAATVHK